MDAFTGLINDISNAFYSYFVIWLLIAVGVIYTFRTRFVQIRLFPTMIKQVFASRQGAAGGVSSFQAFCVGLASRVGTGNLAGVAIALALGGPGAIFWMWLVALIGMATGFAEATLAQIYKRRSPDGSYRGGPAYYIQYGLGSRRFGILFAVLLVFTFGFAFNMVQANTIAGTFDTAWGLNPAFTALILMVLVGPILFGGIRRIARVSEIVLPLMAGAYLLIAAVILIMNIGFVPEFFRQIFLSAFGLDTALAGTGGGLIAALLNGVRRGLFSNEAGMGSAPNTAATATVSHPVKQGLIQSFGVFLDTMIICSATAFVIMASGIYTPGVSSEGDGAAMTQLAVADHLGDWTAVPMTLLVFVFAFTSLFGNYSYAEVNMNFLGVRGRGLNFLRVAVILAVGLGAIAALDLVWALADVAMGAMAVTNLIAVLLLSKWVIGALRDFQDQRRMGRDDRFVVVDNPDLPGNLPESVWTPDKAETLRVNQPVHD